MADRWGLRWVTHRVRAWTRHRVVLLGLAVLALLLSAPAVLALPRAAHAGSLDIEATSYESANPNSITFRARVSTTSPLRTATLVYEVANPTGGNVGGQGQSAISGGTREDLSFTLETRTAQRFIPVGSLIRYYWNIADSDGATQRTPQQEFVFLDGRYQWQSRSDGQVTAYWYGSNASFAATALAAAKSSLDDTGRLLGVRVSYPVRVLIWSSTAEGADAVRLGQRVETEQTRLGGERVSPDVVFVFQRAPDVVRHEVAHIVTHVAGDGAFSRVPSWLDEGTAVYEQSENDLSYALALQQGIQNDKVLSLRSINTQPGQSDLTLLFYGQSFATVQYLVKQYGPEQFAKLYQALFSGTRIDDALMQVYKFDQDGLYNEWRQSVGLKPVAIQPRGSNAAGPLAEGTLGPLGLATPGAGSADAGSAGSSTSVGGVPIIGVIVGLVTLLLAGGLGAGAWVLLRRGRANR